MAAMCDMNVQCHKNVCQLGKLVQALYATKTVLTENNCPLAVRVCELDCTLNAAGNHSSRGMVHVARDSGTSLMAGRKEALCSVLRKHLECQAYLLCQSALIQATASTSTTR